MISQLKKLLKLRHVLPKYSKIEYDSRTLQKMRGKDSHGKPLDFNDEEKKKIIAGIDLVIEQLNKIKIAIQKSLKVLISL